MRPSKLPVYLSHCPLFDQCAHTNVPFRYSIHRYLPNAPLQMSLLAIPFPAIYPMTTPTVPFSNSIPGYLPNAPLQKSLLPNPFPAIYPMRTTKRPVYLFQSSLITQCAPPNVRFRRSIPRYLPNAALQTTRLAIPFPAIYPMRLTKRPD